MVKQESRWLHNALSQWVRHQQKHLHKRKHGDQCQVH
jgi:hypothetical protein